MKQLVGRLIVAVWFLGMVWVAVRTTPIQGQTGELQIQQFPLLFRNAPAVEEPDLRSYLGLFTSNMRQPTGDQELYTVRADGSELRQLTDNEVLDNAPAWSPNGQQIAYIEDMARVMVMNVDGSDKRVVYEMEGEEPTVVSWLPNSRTLLIFSLLHRVYRVEVDTGDTDIVVNDGGSHPGLSPDGRNLVYTPSTDGGGLWSIAVSGGTPQQVCSNCAFVAWHPHNGRILFTQEEQGILATLDGTSQWYVYEAPFQFSHWLLVGNRVLLTNSEDGDVYTVGITGGTPEILIELEASLAVLGVSPRDSSILYVTPFGAGRGERLYVQPLDGTSAILIPDTICGATYCFSVRAQWADDGSHFLYITEEQSYRVIGTRIQGVDMDSATPVVRDLLSGPIARDSFHLPFSSASIYSQYYAPSSYPGPSLPLIIDASVPSVQALPFDTGATTDLVEWRYMP